MNKQTVSDSNIGQDVQRQRKARLMMFAIVAVFVLPFLVLPLLGSPEQMGKTNKGLLIQPHIFLPQLLLQDEQGKALQEDYLSGKWNLLYVIPDDCDTTCALARDHALYAIRQVRLSLGRDEDRVQLLMVYTSELDAALDSLINKEFADMKRARGDRQVLESILFARVPENSPAGNIFLMSPDGYIFMAYPTFVDEQESVLRARDIRADLSKSIKGDRQF